MICSFLNCPYPVENKDTGLCARHGAEMRKAERDSLKEKAKRKPLAKFSEKKADKLKPYAVLRRNYLKENPVCELHLQECQGLSQEIHHCSTSEKDFLNTKTWKASCVSCHRRCEEKLSATERREKGLLL